MEGQMVTVPAVKGRGNVDRSVHKCRVQGERERKESQWNISERKGECQRVESSAAQSRKCQGRKKQAIVVNHWQDQAQQCETASCNQKHAAGAEQAAKINSKWTDKHERDVESAADPRSIGKPNTQASFQVGNTKCENAAGQRDNPSTHDHAQNPEQGTLREFRWQHSSNGVGELSFCR